MNSERPIVAIKNIGWLILVAFPIFFLLVWVQSQVMGEEGRQNLYYALETGAFYYLGSFIYVLIGGSIHQIIILFIPLYWSQVIRRIAAVILSCVIPGFLILVVERTETVTDFIVPVIVSTIIYGLLISIPE